MTIEDLYCYAQERGIENMKVEIQYSDGGGNYCGTRDLEEFEIEIQQNTYETVVIL